MTRAMSTQAVILNQKLLNAAPDITLFGTIVGACLLNWFAPVAKFIGSPFRYVAGSLLVVVGMILATRSIALLRNRASSDVVRTSKILITDDLYAWSRNPLYVSELLIVMGVAAVLGSLSAFAAPVVYVAAVRWFVIPFEENQLWRKFGPKYEAYARSVRRWV